MSTVVHGQDVIVEKQEGSEWKAVYCAISCVFSYQNETLGYTDVNAGISKKRRVVQSDCSMSVSGVTTLYDDDVLSPFYFLDEGRSREEGTYRMVFTETETGGRRAIQFAGIVESVQLDGDVNEFSKCELSILPSGGFDIVEVETPTPVEPEGVFSDWWVTTEGAHIVGGSSAVRGYSLVHKKILEVDREGTQYDIILTGTPSGRQCKYNELDGEIAFDPSLPFNNGETVFVLFENE